MARVMYFDCFSGAAGDMLLGALLDAGLPVGALRAALGSLGVDHEVEVSSVIRCGVTATKFDVRPHATTLTSPRGLEAHDHAHGPEHGPSHSHQHHGTDEHRSLKDIADLIGQSALSAAGKARAVSLFRRLAEAEAAIHGTSIDDVHLHEVGALDSIIDIVGAVFALEWFGIDDIESSPLNVGAGTVEIAHGRFPVPAPATLRLLQGVPIYSEGPKVELVTPTGALLVSGYARAFGSVPPMVIERVGYGAGTRDMPSTPNVMRVLIGERMATARGPLGTPTVLKIECEIDDMSPQLFGPASDRLFDAGALDVYLTPVFMKKGRPGTLVTVLLPEDRRPAITTVLFRETTTIGVRMERVEREMLDRRWEEVPVTGGVVRIKVASRDGETLNAAPEFEDCLQVANATGAPLKTVQAEALRVWWGRKG